MLNNDFKVLVQKYERYKREKRKSRNRKILFFIILAALAYYLSTQNFSQENIVENNHTKPATTVTKLEVNQSNQAQEIIEKVPVKKSESTPAKVVKKEKNQTQQPKVNQLRLQVTTKKDSLYQLLENQAKYKNYSSTIAVANYHYSKKEYQKAIKWAIEASKKNKSKARPWIIYAKSKKALGHDEIAKKALTLYLKRHQSQEVQELLNSL